MRPHLALGLDFGTSGARCCVIDAAGELLFTSRCAFPDPRGQTPGDWAEALETLLDSLPVSLRPDLAHAAICATSGTVLLADSALRPVGPALAYFDTRAEPLAQDLRRTFPGTAQVDALARILWLWREHGSHEVAHALHQADWITAQLLKQTPATDWHNALKSGADVAQGCWPPQARSLPVAHLLPPLTAPGALLGVIAAHAARRYGLPPGLQVHAGTTDSNAAFLATGADRLGQAVTTLGSTLTLKLLSATRVDSSAHGVYSHRWGRFWLAGGASNAGGAALRALFSDAELQTLSARIDAEMDSPLDLYPLAAVGERFPIRDPAMAPRLSPRPADDVAYLHGLLQALARIEAAGYHLLAELGAAYPTEVITTGGGAQNATWSRLRERALGVPVHRATHTEAAYGAARLALLGADLAFPSPLPAA